MCCVLCIVDSGRGRFSRFCRRRFGILGVVILGGGGEREKNFSIRRFIGGFFGMRFVIEFCFVLFFGG